MDRGDGEISTGGVCVEKSHGVRLSLLPTPTHPAKGTEVQAHPNVSWVSVRPGGSGEYACVANDWFTSWGD